MAKSNTKAAAEKPQLNGEWNEMRSVRLPKAREGEDKSMYVSVNGVAYWVPKGVRVDVPLPIYEVIQRAIEAEEDEIDMRESIPNEG